MANDPYTDDEYDDTYKKVHGDEGAREQYTDDGTDDTFFPTGRANRFAPSGWGIWPTSNTADAEYADRGAGGPESQSARRDAERTEGDGWLDEGLIGLVLVAGIALFLFPEPATSAVGIVLITLGVIGWIIDWLA
jgi:hypothetical protein